MGAPPTLSALTGPRPLRRALTAYVLDVHVEMATWVAIIVWAYGQGGVTLVGVVAVAQLAPAAILAPALAGLGDRIARGRALALTHLAVAVAAGATGVAIVLESTDVVVVTASAVATVTFSVVRPLHFASVPCLARTPDELVSANALSSLATGVALFVGPFLAGITAEALGPQAVFGAGAALALTAAVLCRRLGTPAPSPGSSSAMGWRDGLAGLTALWRQRTLLVILVMSTGSVISGATDVLGVSVSHELLGLGDAGAGIIIGAAGLGMALGSIVAGPLARRRRLAPVTVASGLAMGAAVGLVVLFGSLWPIVVLLALAGAGGAVQVVAGRTLLQRTSDDRVLARVFGVEEGASLLALALGASVAPFFVESLGPGPAFLPLGAGAALFTLTAVVALLRLDSRTRPRTAEIELLRQVPFLEVLRPYELEQLARAARWVTVDGGTDVVVQGDVGDCFYVVGDGRLGVSVDGVARPHVLSPGESFGEIALLHRVPRTATITTLTPTRLLALDGADFLRTVTGHPDGSRLAADVAQARLDRDRQLPG